MQLAPQMIPTRIRGTNQRGMRAYNERLVLTLLRRHGPQPKAQIARLTGLSAQTVSVIMRGLESEGLLVKGEPMRGRVGQPSVPMGLAPEGAFFLGLKIGRRTMELVLTNFIGEVVERRLARHGHPTPDGTLDFARKALPNIVAGLDPDQRARVAGLGIAMPFQLWHWAPMIGAPQEEMDDWRHRDIRAELAAEIDIPVYLQNDASAACGAELVQGASDLPTSFLHFFVGYFIGGGVVLNGDLFTGASGNAGALASIPVAVSGGSHRQLIELASLATLERMLCAEGHASEQLWLSPSGWMLDGPVLDRWVATAGDAIAHAIVSACSVIDFEAVLVDGWLPSGLRRSLVARIRENFDGMSAVGLTVPEIREGTVGAEAKPLGASVMVLSERFLVRPGALTKEAGPEA